MINGIGRPWLCFCEDLVSGPSICLCTFLADGLFDCSEIQKKEEEEEEEKKKIRVDSRAPARDGVAVAPPTDKASSPQAIDLAAALPPAGPSPSFCAAPVVAQTCHPTIAVDSPLPLIATHGNATCHRIGWQRRADEHMLR